MKKLLLKIARTPCMGALIGWMIAHLSPILPLRMIADNRFTVAFRHPAPSYPDHLLIMPKARVRDISRADASLISHVLSAADAAITILNLRSPHIMLWTNGGRFQEVRQLHFHLFPSDLDREADLHELRRIRIGAVPVRECVRGGEGGPDFLILQAGTEAFAAVFPELMVRYRLETRGYSVFWDLSPHAARQGNIFIRIG